MPSPIETRPPSTAGIDAIDMGGDGAPDIEQLIETSAAQSAFGDFMRSLPVSLSPAMIFAMLQRRMQGFDNQILAGVNAMEAQQETLAGLQENVEILLALKAKSTAQGNISLAEPVTIGDETKTAQMWIEQIGIEVRSSPAEEGEGTHHLVHYKAANLTAAVDALQAQIKQVNTGTELKMMDLQSLMQQRSSEISLATNMLKSIQDGTDAIVRNIG